jgi:hypothetical protein
MRDKRLTAEQFVGVSVPRSFAKTPPELDKADPMSFLYQAGYLSLRLPPEEAEDQSGPVPEKLDDFPRVETDSFKLSKTTEDVSYTLDYPNVEERSAMSKRVLESVLDDDDVEAWQALKRVKKAFDSEDVNGLIEEYNDLLARLPYEDYKKGLSKTRVKDSTIVDPGELLCRSLMFSLLWGAGLRPIGELHGRLGRSDIVVPHNGGHWVIELKISHNTVQDDRAKAKEALNQILTQGYAEGLGKPIILLGLAVNEPQRKATTWVKRVGLAGDDVWTLLKPPKPASSPPPEVQPA